MKNVRRKFKSKGIVDVQFNWIFILVAGFIIFLFIISIVLIQKKNSDAQAGIAAINQINTILKGKQQATDVYSEISFPSTAISFACDPDTEYFTFKIESADRVQLPLEIIFAPQQLTGNKVEVWSQSFNMPFPVTAFTYITTSDTAILVYNTTPSSNAKVIYDTLPGNMSKFYISGSTINKYNAFSTKRIVCIEGSGCPSSGNFVKINPAPHSDIFDYGNVTFYTNGFPTGSSPYITEPGLFGAIFSDNNNYYSCQMSRAIDQFNVKLDLIESRLSLFTQSLPYGQCNDSISIVLNDNIVPMSNMKFVWSNITAMNYMGKALITRNTDLTLGSCPKMY